MVLDIEIIRQNPQLVRDSQIKRYKGTDSVDRFVTLDARWRTVLYQLEQWRKVKNLCGQIVGEKKRAKEDEGDCEDLPKDLVINLETLTAEYIRTLAIKQIKRLSGLVHSQVGQVEEQLIQIETERDGILYEIGNLVHDSVPVSDDEVRNGLLNISYVNICCVLVG